MKPKQIIYPLHYIKPWFAKDPDRLERKFISSLSQRIDPECHYLALGRARSGIYLMSKLFIDKNRKKVILSPYTIPDVVNMIRFAGGIPVFVDCLPKSTNIDLQQLESLIDEQTASVMITHYHVNQNQYGEIIELCNRKEIGLFEDCAISAGGTIQDKTVGYRSAGGIFSHSSFKFLNFFWGGVLFTKDPDYSKRIGEEAHKWKRLTQKQYRGQILRTLKYDLATRPLLFKYITASIIRRKLKRSNQDPSLKPVRVESTSMDNTLTTRPAAAAFAEWNRKIDDLHKHLRHRRKIAGIYQERLKPFMVSSETSDSISAGSCFVNYPVYVGKNKRHQIYKELFLAGIDTSLSLYPNVHKHPEFEQIAGYSDKISDLVDSVITLPTHPRISKDDALEIVEKIKPYL